MLNELLKFLHRPRHWLFARQGEAPGSGPGQAAELTELSDRAAPGRRAPALLRLSEAVSLLLSQGQAAPAARPCKR